MRLKNFKSFNQPEIKLQLSYCSCQFVAFKAFPVILPFLLFNVYCVWYFDFVSLSKFWLKSGHLKLCLSSLDDRSSTEGIRLLSLPDVFCLSSTSSHALFRVSLTRKHVCANVFLEEEAIV